MRNNELSEVSAEVLMKDNRKLGHNPTNGELGRFDSF